MSIQSEIERISQAKTDIHSAIESKGVTVPDDTLISEMAPYIQQIREAGTVVTSVNNIRPDDNGNVNITIPTELPNPSALTIQQNGSNSITYDGSATRTVNITPSGIGAATSAQGSKADTAVQPSDLDIHNIDSTETNGRLIWDEYSSQGESVILTRDNSRYLLNYYNNAYCSMSCTGYDSTNRSFTAQFIYQDMSSSTSLWEEWINSTYRYYALPGIQDTDEGKLVAVQDGKLNFVKVNQIITRRCYVSNSSWNRYTGTYPPSSDVGNYRSTLSFNGIDDDYEVVSVIVTGSYNTDTITDDQRKAASQWTYAQCETNRIYLYAPSVITTSFYLLISVSKIEG